MKPTGCTTSVISIFAQETSLCSFQVISQSANFLLTKSRAQARPDLSTTYFDLDDARFFFPIVFQRYVTKVSNPKFMWRQDTKLCEHAAICNNLWWVVFKCTTICNNYHLLKGHKPGHFLSRQRCRFRGQRWISLIILILTISQADSWKYSM